MLLFKKYFDLILLSFNQEVMKFGKKIFETGYSLYHFLYHSWLMLSFHKTFSDAFLLLIYYHWTKIIFNLIQNIHVDFVRLVPDLLISLFSIKPFLKMITFVRHIVKHSSKLERIKGSCSITF